MPELRDSSQEDHLKLNGYAEQLHAFTERVIESHPDVWVYANNNEAVRTNAIQTTFSFCQHFLDKEIFTSLARVYARHYPCMTRDINLYGESFPDLIESQLNSSKADLFDWLRIASIARLEYAITLVYYSDAARYSQAKPLRLEENPLSADLMPLFQQQHPYCRCEPLAPDASQITLYQEQSEQRHTVMIRGVK